MMAPEPGPDDMETAALKAKNVKTEFTGTCVPLPIPPLYPGETTYLPNGRTHIMGYIADWYDEASDPRVTGVSRWFINYFREGAPFASDCRCFGKVEIFVGGDAESNDGVWDVTCRATMTLANAPGPPFTAICYCTGVGKSGIVKGLTCKWIYTLAWGPAGEVKYRFGNDPDSSEEIQHMERSGNLIESIAVLPFDNFSGDESQAYLVFGMHDALISELGQLEGLRVISKTSTLCYAGSKRNIREIANELGVDAVIEGSVLIVEDTIRIDLKLFSPSPEEKQLWAQSFEMNLGNILIIFSEAIKKIATEIRIKLSPEKQIRLDEPREVNPESYKAILRGKYNICQQTPEAVNKGLEYLHQAVLIDPAEPFAYASLAQGYLDLAHGPFNPGDAYKKAESAVTQAMKLDQNSAETLTAFAEICMYSTWKFDRAERYFKRSLELNPNLTETHYHYAWALYLFGRNEEALIEQKIAQKYDPFNPLMTAVTGALYSYLGQYENGLREAYRSFEILKDFPFGYWVLGETYLALEEQTKAVEAHEKLVEPAPEWTWRLGETYALTGQHDKAEKMLIEVEKGPINSWTAMGLAALYGALGKNGSGI